MKIREIMTREVQTCFTSDNLADVALKMWHHDCGCCSDSYLPSYAQGRRKRVLEFDM